VRSSRLAALVILAGVIAGGLVLDAAESPEGAPPSETVVAGVAMPAAAPAGSLSSTWYCAGGTATDKGFADHVVVIANPTDEPRRAVVTVLTGVIAPKPLVADTSGESTTTTAPPETTTTAAPPEPPPPSVVDVPAQSRVEVSLRDLVHAPLASAIVEVEGGEVAVEHQVTTLAEGGGRATSSCSSTAAREWSFPWGVTSRGARELLVFMNPFPDDATVTIDFATDEGTRQTLRFQNFVVPGRSVVGAFVDQDVTRREQVSAQVHVGSGRLVVDRIQTFDGTDPALEGITLGLGAPELAEVWVFPAGRLGEGATEQAVVFNPTNEVAEVEVEVRLDDPETNGVPEPFEVTVAPHRYEIVDLHEPDLEVTETTPRRVPDGVDHSIIVRSLNGVPVAVEKVLTRSEPQANLGVSATLGAPLAAPTWILAAGGVSEERRETVSVYNPSDHSARISVHALDDGRTLEIESLQDLEIAPGGFRRINVNDHVDIENLALVITADGPVSVERGLFRIDGRGIAQSMGIPIAVDTLVFDPLEG
jgi:hypothetical protein